MPDLIYRLAYEFHRRWFPCPRTPEDWAAAAAEMGRISCDAGNVPLLMDFLQAVYEDMSRNWEATEQKDGGDRMARARDGP